MLLQLINTITTTGRKRILSLLAFLIALFVLLPSAIFTYAMYQLLILWQTFYYYIVWSLLGFSQVFLVYYVIILAFPDFFRRNWWAIILPIIGLIAYVPFTFLSAPSIQIHFSGFLIYNVVYMLLIPLYATYHYLQLDRIQGTTRVKWILVTTLGLILWFIGLELMFYPTFSWMPGLVIPIGITALAWWIIFIGSVFFTRG